MKTKSFLSIIICLIFATSCKPSSEQTARAIEETKAAWTDVPTSTPYPTYTQYPTQTPQPTATDAEPSPPTATNTETITPAPIKTSPPSATESPLTMDHYDGIYGVGIDIAPGKWQVNDPFLLMGNPDCYWARYNVIGNIVEDEYGQKPPFIITVLPSDTLVELDHCRRVIYLGP